MKGFPNQTIYRILNHAQFQSINPIQMHLHISSHKVPLEFNSQNSDEKQ
jgi:hypothetical protein